MIYLPSSLLLSDKYNRSYIKKNVLALKLYNGSEWLFFCTEVHKSASISITKVLHMALWLIKAF